MQKDASDHRLSDEEIIHRYRNSHDTAYVGELYTRYTHLVYAVCLKYLKEPETARDAVMQIFEKLLTDLKKHDIRLFKPWLHTVVRNHCMMHFRAEASKMKVVQREPLHMENNESMHPADVENHAAEKEWILAQLETGLENLREEQGKCLKLFYLEERSYKEISEQTGFPLSDVKSHIQNGKRNLKIYLDRQNEQKEQA